MTSLFVYGPKSTTRNFRNVFRFPDDMQAMLCILRNFTSVSVFVIKLSVCTATIVFLFLYDSYTQLSNHYTPYKTIMRSVHFKQSKLKYLIKKPKILEICWSICLRTKRNFENYYLMFTLVSTKQGCCFREC